MDIAQLLKGEWTRCASEGVPLAVLTIAPDNPADGKDSVWCNDLERALHVHCGRVRDVVAGVGDGSFVAILPNTMLPGARHVGERIVEAMRCTPRSTGTVSVGISGVVPSGSEHALALLSRSADALRFAQEQGGDRCAGGGSPAASTEKPMARLRRFLRGSSPPPGRRRRTD